MTTVYSVLLVLHIVWHQFITRNKSHIVESCLIWTPHSIITTVKIGDLFLLLMIYFLNHVVLYAIELRVCCSWGLKWKPIHVMTMLFPISINKWVLSWTKQTLIDCLSSSNIHHRPFDRSVSFQRCHFKFCTKFLKGCWMTIPIRRNMQLVFITQPAPVGKCTLSIGLIS